MSSEEILRHGKTVHHQDASLDSAPSLSGELLHTDHAGTVFRFSSLMICGGRKLTVNALL